MPNATLKFQDGATVVLPVEDGQTVVEAALETDAPLRSDCMSGTCGTCIARRMDGSVALEPLVAPIVDGDEAAGGLYPTCLTRLQSDATFELDYPLHPKPALPTRHAARLVALERVAETVSRLTCELSTPEEFRFQPGQYVRLRPPGLKVARAYSIASAPDALPLLELLIRHVPGGQVSSWLQDGAAPGARLALQGPLGGFALDDRHARAVFVVGGTGLAPALSMIRAAVGTIPMLLCFGCTRASELFLHDELAALATSVPDLEVRVAVMEGATTGVRTGTAVALLADDLSADAAYHLCGPPAMVDAARAVLRKGGVPAAQIRAERFAIGG